MAQATPTPRGIDIDIDDAALALHTPRLSRTLKNAAWELWMNRSATVGAVMICILFLVSILAPVIATHDPVKQNYRERLQGPSAAHYFGTDKFGRDIWSRTVWGCQRLVTIAVLAVIVGLLGGIPLGVISGYYGGKVDLVMMRVVDAWLAFPGIIFYLLAATLIRAYELSLFWNTVGLIIALGVARMPDVARLVRGTVLAEREKDYVEASVVYGGGAPVYRLSPGLAQLPVAGHRAGHHCAGLRIADHRHPVLSGPGRATANP